MASFLRRIVSLFSGPRPLGERVYLGAFGKHPGWDDHIDDIGLETDYLTDLKRCLYIEGIGGNIDANTWQGLETENQALPFDHQFVWLRDSDVLVGRLWASRDGKGRTRYPMVVAGHCVQAPLERAVTELLPRLEQVREACVAARDAIAVREVLATAQRELRDRMANAGEQPAAGAEIDWKTRLVGCASQNADECAGPRGILSAIYQIEREMSDYCREDAIGIQPRDSTTLLGLPPAQPPQPLRVPTCADTTADAMQLWSALLRSLLEPDTPILFLRSMQGNWLDLIVGEPTPLQLYCLRAPPQKLPFTTQIPYTLNATFVERAGRFIGLDDATIATIAASAKTNQIASSEGAPSQGATAAGVVSAEPAGT